MEGKTLDLIEGDQKKRKLENAEENDQNSPDRISSLPDEIICYILSFVPTINVVQTCILSRRWQNIWISVPILYLDDDSVTSEIGMKHFEDTMATRIKFMNLLNNFMMRRVSSPVPIQKFHLSTCFQFRGSHVNEWLSSAVGAGVEELDIHIEDIEDDFDYALPSSLFNCSSLVTLKLSFGDLKFRIPEFFSLPNLKWMHLDSVILAKNFHHQLSNCPNLEMLCLNEFFIDLVSPCSETFEDHSGILPNLHDVFIGTVYNYQRPVQEFGGWLGAFIRKLSNVQNLHLGNANILKFLQYSEVGLLNHLPTFCNLKHLNLEVSSEDVDVVEVLTCLLQRSLLLESLHLRYVFLLTWPQNFQGKLKSQERFSNCQLGKLKKITVQNFWGSEKQIDLARLFFGNVQLEEIVIYITAPWYASLSLRQQLLKFPRLSTLVLLYNSSEEEVVEESFNVNEPQGIFITM